MRLHVCTCVKLSMHVLIVRSVFFFYTAKSCRPIPKLLNETQIAVRIFFFFFGTFIEIYFYRNILQEKLCTL